MPTAQTPIRLSDEDRARIEAIRRWAGLPTLAAAVRYAVNRTHDQIGAGHAPGPARTTPDRPGRASSS